jgi:transmembrane sensor
MTDPAHAPLPPALVEALDRRADGAELGALWHTLPAPPAATDDAAAHGRRDLAWRRLSGRILDPARVPTLRTEDLAPITLLADADADARARAARRVSGQTSPARAHSVMSTRVWRVAAAIMLLLCGAAAWHAVPQELAVAAGATPATVTLADGSRVTLSPGSQLRVARGFRTWYGAKLTERTVRLTGRAFFGVTHDGRSFTVETGDATVRVLGTHFDVRSATLSVGTRVMVEDGRVSMRGRADSTPALTLNAGDAAIIGASGAAARRAVESVARATNWRTGGLAVVNEPLGDVLADLARRAGVEITLARDVASGATVTLFYAHAPSLERVLTDLSAARALRFTRSSRGFRVSAGAPTP